MYKIKRNDVVQVITGKDRDKKGKILHLFAGKRRAIVEGINLVKKHQRRTQQDQQGKIAQVPMAIHLSNLMLICKNCNRPRRAGFKTLTDGTKSRICKKCKQPI